MPINKKPMNSDMPIMPPAAPAPLPPKPPAPLHAGLMGCGCGKSSFGKQILWTLGGIFLVYMTFYVGVLTRNTIRQFDFIGYSEQQERSITVNGYGKASGNNDIAVTSIGYSNTDPDVSKAQADNKKVMDGILADLKKLGIADKDLQTSYSINPQYNYTTDKGEVFVGYKVDNSVTVKIRDLSKIPSVLGLAGKYNANEVDGLTFTIDDPESLKNDARLKAVADAKAKAMELANNLGVRLVAVMSYNEYDAGTTPMPYMAMDRMVANQVGLSTGPAAVASGSQDVAMNVSITYKILP